VNVPTRTVLGIVLLVAVVGLVSAGEDDVKPLGLLEARLDANETTAIATLRNLCSAQAQFQACGLADEDNDGTGEYGCFAELSGALPVRGTKNVISPPVLSGAFKLLTKQGTVHRAGYVFAITLPGKKGVPIAEGPDGGITPGVLDPDLAEANWLVYAWPERHPTTGRRTFVMNQGGDIFATKQVYSGEKGPAPTAALAPSKAKGTPITGKIVSGKPASDGLTWTRNSLDPSFPMTPREEERDVRAARGAVVTSIWLVKLQHRFRLEGHVDEDDDGAGEFCTLGEMVGTHCFRGTTKRHGEKLLAGALAPDGTYRIDGYRYAVWLPGPGGIAVRETKNGLAGGRTDPDLAEKSWVLYAWPEAYGRTGFRTYVATQGGFALQVIADRYSGDKMPEPGAAFQPVKTKPVATILGPICTDRTVWTQVN
jgi:hypothetical protein